MKIGILTFQNANSYGAVSQNFALQEAVKKICGQDSVVEVINYDSPGMRLKEFQMENYREFCVRRLELSQEFTSAELKEEKKYDVIIVGSDQVWNPILTHYDNTYFLDFVGADTVKVAYAASVGVNAGYFDKIKEPFSQYVPGFHAVSLREKSHIPFVQQYTELEVANTLDPTLLLHKEDYIEKLELKDSQEEYIFLYNIAHNPKLIDFANMVAKQYGYKVIAVTIYEDFCFVNNVKLVRNPSPEKWMEYIKNAKMVLTESFHGVMMSIIFKRPFYVYTKETYNVVRVLDVLKMLGLEDRKLSAVTDIRNLNFEINYDRVDEILEEKRSESINWLTESIKKESGR